jgi:hypothetical protein
MHPNEARTPLIAGRDRDSAQGTKTAACFDASVWVQRVVDDSIATSYGHANLVVVLLNHRETESLLRHEDFDVSKLPLGAPVFYFWDCQVALILSAKPITMYWT